MYLFFVSPNDNRWKSKLMFLNPHWKNYDRTIEHRSHATSSYSTIDRWSDHWIVSWHVPRRNTFLLQIWRFASSSWTIRTLFLPQRRYLDIVHVPRIYWLEWPTYFANLWCLQAGRHRPTRLPSKTTINEFNKTLLFQRSTQSLITKQFFMLSISVLVYKLYTHNI